MAQSDDEIKMNSNESSALSKNVRPVAKSISRDFKTREISLEPKFDAEPLPDEAIVASRREFFQCLWPGTGKLLTTFVRTVETTVSMAVERKK